MQTNVPFTSSQIKLDRAKEHFYTLQTEIQTFLDSKPYELRIEEEPQTGDLVYRVRVKAEPPIKLSLITGDIIHNLRSALDHLIYQLIVINGKTPNKNSAFPIYTRKADFDTDGHKKINGIGAAATTIIKAIKPYKEGNLHLWQLSQLDNADKHRLIITVGSAHRNIIIDMAYALRQFPRTRDLPPMPIALRSQDREFPLKDNAEVFRIMKAARGTSDEANHQATFEIAIGEGEIIQGDSLVESLQKFIEETESVITQFQPLLT